MKIGQLILFEMPGSQNSKKKMMNQNLSPENDRKNKNIFGGRKFVRLFFIFGVYLVVKDFALLSFP